MPSGKDSLAGCPVAPGGYDAPPQPLGPDSLTWKYFGDWRGLLQGPWAGSMQNMHPQLGAATVAFPAISTGVYGYPLELAAPVAIGAVRDADTRVGQVRFVLFDRAAYEAFERALG